MKLVVLLISVGLVGCASMKPDLPDALYDQANGQAFAMQRCVAEGHMSSEVGAMGIRFTRNTLSNYKVDEARLNDSYKRIQSRKESITSADCNIIAMKIAEINRGSLTPVTNNQPAYTPTYQAPKSTYCNKIGSQVFCNSF